jgi:5'(3')-deoxyribonucleotidase
MKISDLTEDGRIVKGVNTTVDVGTNEIPIQAKKFGNSVTKDGTPPSLSTKVKGKSTNVLFNLGLAEGYKLQLERDKQMLVLNITNTKTGQRTEVRGKPGYESGNYDPNDDLHQLLDTIGKSADISQLMNGEPVGINPKHPDGASAKAATDKAYNERSSSIMREIQNVHFLEALGEIAPNTEIYVDMDGVLADFFGEWSKSQGVSNWKDIKDPAKAIGDIKSIEDFWLKLPVLPQAKNLLQLIKKVKGSYSICTSPLADDPRSEPHKREWVKKNLAFFPPKEVIVTHNKPQFATQKDGTPNILIDDYGVNIRAWEEAGGIGFKYKDYKFQRTAKAIKQKMTTEVTIDNKNGRGAVPNNMEVDYFGKKVMMKPSTFIKLASKLGRDPDPEMIDYIKKGGAIGAPFLVINVPWDEDDDSKLKVRGHEGRNRMLAILKAEGDAPVETHLFFDGKYNRARHLEPEFIAAINKELVSQDDQLVKGPLFTETVEENFADGKKKGKSRPGRVKKSGASCNGSVTALRKRAKNASGEKAKMYHWCANMKSGKKKKK